MDHLHESMFTALIDDKVDFVSLFLNEGLKLKDFLTVDVLCSLYAGVSHFHSCFPAHAEVVEGYFAPVKMISPLLDPYLFCGNSWM